MLPEEGIRDPNEPFIRIVEQPASKALRFRYECEGRSAGSIPGARSTPDNKTHPAIEVRNIEGPYIVIVSCVTKEYPYKPHPHKIVGKNGCTKGIYMTRMVSGEKYVTFSNLGIQCVKRKDTAESLKTREDLRIDPFQTGFDHKSKPAAIDLNCLRLCFQVFLQDPETYRFRGELQPVVSQTIYDKKFVTDLIIYALSHYAASADGDTEVVLLCSKLTRKPVKIRFYELDANGKLLWEAFGKTKKVYQQRAIVFRTPAFRSKNIAEPTKVWVQLTRESDESYSESVLFEMLPVDCSEYWEYHKRKRQQAFGCTQSVFSMVKQAQGQAPGQSFPSCGNIGTSSGAMPHPQNLCRNESAAGPPGPLFPVYNRSKEQEEGESLDVNDFDSEELKVFDLSKSLSNSLTISDSISDTDLQPPKIKTNSASDVFQPNQARSSTPNHTTPFVRILEQPAGKATRFRYECEGRSASSIPGVNSTPDNKTYPAIEVVNYNGPFIVIVSCVTKDQPFRPHPHKIVGKEGCEKGIFMTKISSNERVVTFSNFGIQCVKRKDMKEALTIREQLRVDPYRTGFNHKQSPRSLDLNSVRLCFQVFIEGPERNKFRVLLDPVVSDPIYDKKSMADLKISGLSHYSAPASGDLEVVLIGEKVTKDLVIRFYEECNGRVVWEDYAKFSSGNVYQPVAVCFRTPAYRTAEIPEAVKVYVQLKRVTDGLTGDPVPFRMVPTDQEVSEYLLQKRQRIHSNSGPASALQEAESGSAKLEPEEEAASPAQKPEVAPFVPGSLYPVTKSFIDHPVFQPKSTGFCFSYPGVQNSAMEPSPGLSGHQPPVAAAQEGYQFVRPQCTAPVFGEPTRMFPVQSQPVPSTSALPNMMGHNGFGQQVAGLGVQRMDRSGHMLPAFSDIEVAANKEDPAPIDLSQFDSDELSVFKSVLNSNVSYNLSDSIKMESENGVEEKIGGSYMGPNLMD